jgi:hypothetical protein
MEYNLYLKELKKFWSWEKSVIHLTNLLEAPTENSSRQKKEAVKVKIQVTESEEEQKELKWMGPKGLMWHHQVDQLLKYEDVWRRRQR